MGKFSVVEIKEDIASRNNALAAGIRSRLAEKGIFYLNVMSSPGSGKTTLIVELIKRLKADYKIGVIETDIDSDTDARTVADATGVKTVQVHTAGACHMTCQMSDEALAALGTDGLDVVILENIGNLVCPAEFDTGATANLVLLSVPEGDDKPLKYPLIYQKCALVLISKLDALPYFPFDIEKCKQNIRRRNPHSTILPVSAKTGDGMDDAAEWFAKAINNFRESK